MVRRGGARGKMATKKRAKNVLPEENRMWPVVPLHSQHTLCTGSQRCHSPKLNCQHGASKHPEDQTLFPTSHSPIPAATPRLPLMLRSANHQHGVKCTQSSLNTIFLLRVRMFIDPGCNAVQPPDSKTFNQWGNSVEIWHAE